MIGIPFFRRKRRFRALRPELVQHQHERVLLVWKDIPHWMVVDSEFCEFLIGLDGLKTWDELLRTYPSCRKNAQTVLDQLFRLEKLGIVSDLASHTSVRSIIQRPADAIENVSINITRRCNLRCPACYALPHLQSQDIGELSGKEVVQFLSSISSRFSKSFSLSLLGGEPLLCPEKVLEITRLAQARNWQCLVSSNGHLVTDSFARDARKANLQVQISLDGHCEETNRMLRGNGAFDKTVAGVRRLVQAKTHTILSMVCHNQNASTLKDYYQLGRELGVSEVRFIPLKLVGGAQQHSARPVALTRLIADADALFKAYPEFRKLAGRDCLSICEAVCKMSAQKPSCGTGKQTFLLDADGTIYPCLNMQYPAFRVGNIREPGFAFDQVWDNSAILDQVRAATSIEQSNNACSGCDVRHWCLGGCHGETFAVKGVLNSRAWNCPDQRKSILETFWRLAEDPNSGVKHESGASGSRTC